MLKGRLGLEKARIPHADRHGLLWLSRGELCVIDGCLHFARGKDSLTPSLDQIPVPKTALALPVRPITTRSWLSTTRPASSLT